MFFFFNTFLLIFFLIDIGTARNHLLIETEDARPEDNAKDYEIDPKQVSGKLRKILNEILNEMKSSRGEWGSWGAWGRCCTGNLELKKGEGLKYSDNPEAVQVRHRRCKGGPVGGWAHFQNQDPKDRRYKNCPFPTEKGRNTSHLIQIKRANGQWGSIGPLSRVMEERKCTSKKKYPDCLDCTWSWRTWGPWGRCCTGNLELKKGGGLRYSDNPEAVQVRHRVCKGEPVGGWVYYASANQDPKDCRYDYNCPLPKEEGRNASHLIQFPSPVRAMEERKCKSKKRCWTGSGTGPNWRRVPTPRRRVGEGLDNVDKCRRRIPLIRAPVCGSDGKNYSNVHLLKREACKTGKPITVKNRGVCKGYCYKKEGKVTKLVLKTEKAGVPCLPLRRRLNSL